MLTRSPMAVVAIARAVVAARVRKTGRAGRASGWPDRASAPAWTVIVCSVPAAQVVVGAMVRTLLVPSQARLTGVAGSTWRAARTENGSIGVLNLSVTGVVTSRLVSTVVVNAASVNGTIGVVGVATVVDVRMAAEDPDPEDEREADRDADPGEGRASHQCADVDRDDDRGGQQRDSGLVQ